MGFDRPTIPALKDRVNADIDGYVAGVEPRLRRSLTGAQAKAEVGLAHGLHGHIAYAAKQILPTMADEQHFGEHASWWGVGRNPATAAGGVVDVVGTDGAVIPVGRVLQRGDGVQYTVDAEVVVAGGVASPVVTCVAPGQDGNALAGTSLTFVTPVSGVQSAATVGAGGLTGGTDIEELEDWRDRLVERVQDPPQGGSLADYVLWAKEVSGVTRVWPFGNWVGPGTVGVFFVRDDDADFIPDAAEVQAVKDHIDTVRQVGMKGLYVMAPEVVAVDMTIKLEPNTSVVQAAVTAEIEDFFRREAQVEDGGGSGTLKLSRIREAISLADGETDHELVVPAANPTFTPGQIAKLGVITYQGL
ncbi:MAG: baseplate J protein [Desulfobulbaceae bacterium]|nr:MAG: baseplate J protein [Desulfobulbaceae bacterium]